MTPAERAARERKQKIFVVVGGLFLVVLLAVQAPRLLDRSGTSTASPAPPESVAGATPAPLAAVPRKLAVSEPAVRPKQGQLSSFSRFDGKDPFVQQVRFPGGSAATGGAATGNGRAGAAAAEKKKTTPAKPAKPSTQGFRVGEPAAAPSMTVISVNGARQTLAPGARFPAADPVFVLVAEQPKAKHVVVGVAGGAYTSGSRTTKLTFEKPLVLVNTATGARYKLVLVAVGNGQAAKPEAKEDENAPAATAETQ